MPPKKADQLPLVLLRNIGAVAGHCVVVRHSGGHTLVRYGSIMN
jgi:hypothetical protein